MLNIYNHSLKYNYFNIIKRFLNAIFNNEIPHNYIHKIFNVKLHEENSNRPTLNDQPEIRI